MLKLDIFDHTEDHVLFSANEPVRIEISLLPTPEGDRILVHAYSGDEIDPDQEPDLVYDGSMSEDMKDCVVYPAPT